eukprot:g4486.t1
MGRHEDFGETTGIAGAEDHDHVLEDRAEAWAVWRTYVQGLGLVHDESQSSVDSRDQDPPWTIEPGEPVPGDEDRDHQYIIVREERGARDHSIANIGKTTVRSTRKTLKLMSSAAGKLDVLDLEEVQVLQAGAK